MAPFNGSLFSFLCTVPHMMFKSTHWCDGGVIVMWWWCDGDVMVYCTGVGMFCCSGRHVMWCQYVLHWQYHYELSCAVCILAPPGCGTCTQVRCSTPCYITVRRSCTCASTPIPWSHAQRWVDGWGGLDVRTSVEHLSWDVPPLSTCFCVGVRTTHMSCTIA